MRLAFAILLLPLVPRGCLSFSGRRAAIHALQC